ncbi:DUF3310 domain-containing protein [Microbacterium sp. MMO-10]|uniref:DUF3310 domain-containing protein n=1 Tax=Microbacterium sp. MMO-10 TaxID=3081272 RepID=UPI0030159361
MARIPRVEYPETVKLLRVLGYDPGGIDEGSLDRDGYRWHGEKAEWMKPDHWERVEAAMRLDEAEAFAKPKADAVEHPAHYTSHPSGVEVIQITRHESFLRGNVIKYVMRAPHKGSEVEDLRKAAQYLAWEIERAEAQAGAV